MFVFLWPQRTASRFLLPLHHNVGCYPKEKRAADAAQLLIIKNVIMEIIGRLTADAKVNELKDGRNVVNFSLATNDNYKVKDSGEVKKVTTYFNCSYWVNANIAQHLTKGTLVELYGRIGVSTFTNKDGETKASLTFHANNIKLHGRPSKETSNHLTVVKNEFEKEGDGLPF